MVNAVPGIAERFGPLIGRSEIHQALLRILEEAGLGRGQLVVLVGEGGVGKSTLLRVTETDARARGFLTLHGRALPSDLPRPFGPIQDLLRSAPSTNAERAASPNPADAGLPLFLAPFEASAHSEGSPLHAAVDRPTRGTDVDRLLDYLTGPPERVEENRLHLFDQLSEFLLRISHQQPVLLTLDDLQFADDSTIEFVQQFAGTLPHARISLVASMAGPADAPPRTAPIVERLLQQPGVVRLTMRRMSEPELAEFAQWLLRGRDPGREAIMRWYTQTEGNPLFVEHLVRGAGGGAGAPGADEATPRLEEMLRARFRGLAEPERRTLVYGAVLGKEFDFPVLATATGQDEEKLSESLDRLVHGGLLREKGGEVYEFVSERLRAEAYSQLTETRRRILHQKVATALESRAPVDSGSVFELARQFYLAREDRKAMEYNRSAAELAALAFAHDTAVVHLERALECARRLPVRDPASELNLMVELGRFLAELGDLKRSEEVLLDAVARARTSPKLEPELALALLWLARTRTDLGSFATARELGTEAFGILGRLHNQRGLLVAHRVLGSACWRVGDIAEAERHQRAELELAEQQGDAWERGHALVDLANTLIQQGEERSQYALGLYETAAQLFAEIRDHASQARVLMNRALLHHNSGRMNEALEDLAKALEAAERSRSRIWIGYCNLNEAQLRVETHEVEAAEHAYERASALLEPLGDQLAHQQLTMIRGMIAEERCEYEGANAAYTEALELARNLSLDPMVAEMHYRIAKLRQKQGDPAAARKLLTVAKEARILDLRGDLALELHALEEILGPVEQS